MALNVFNLWIAYVNSVKFCVKLDHQMQFSENIPKIFCSFESTKISFSSGSPNVIFLHISKRKTNFFLNFHFHPLLPTLPIVIFLFFRFCEYLLSLLTWIKQFLNVRNLSRKINGSSLTKKNHALMCPWFEWKMNGN